MDASFPHGCAHEVDVGTCGAFNTDLLAGLSAFANLFATDHEVSKIHMQPLVCKMNVFIDVAVLVDEVARQCSFTCRLDKSLRQAGARNSIMSSAT